VAGARTLAAGAGAAFAVGAVAGVLGNNLAEGPWFWAGFVTLTVVGSGLSAWLTYRGATSDDVVSVTHEGDNTIHTMRGGGSGPTIGMNYGEVRGGERRAG
jgi:hypothetical protein